MNANLQNSSSPLFDRSYWWGKNYSSDSNHYSPTKTPNKINNLAINMNLRSCHPPNRLETCKNQRMLDLAQPAKEKWSRSKYSVVSLTWPQEITLQLNYRTCLANGQCTPCKKQDSPSNWLMSSKWTEMIGSLLSNKPRPRSQTRKKGNTNLN